VTSRRRFVVALAAAVLFAGVAAGLAIALLADDDGGSEVEEVREAAGRFAEVFNSYDHQDLDAHRDGVLALATGSFRNEYAEGFDQGLREVIRLTEATQQAFVKDVYVSTIDEERAQAIVTVDITHSGTSGSRTVRDIYSRLTLVRVQGGWKVDQVTDLNFDVATGGGPEGGAAGSTSTTAPATTASADVPVP
jgi:Mce-associated membrane protein